MLNSVVGYTGGDTEWPTYESVCARNNTHTEALLLEIDPKVLTFERLIRHFAYENPRLRGFGRSPSALLRPQTKTAIFAQDAEQAESARRVFDEAGLAVPVLPASRFYPAENYHQHHIAEEKDYPGGGDDDPWAATDGPGTAWGL